MDDPRVKSTESPEADHWWSGPGGPHAVLKVAFPLMMSAGFVSITLFTDRTLLYWHSELAASAAMGGGSVYWTLGCLPIGMLGYVSTFVAQYRGAGRPRAVGPVYRHFMRLAAMLVPAFVVAILLTPWMFSWFGHEAKLADLESDYLRILLIGGIAVLFYSVQSGFLTGQEKTLIVLAIDGVATLLNLILDYVLIFGLGPIPAFGLHGAAIATAVSLWLKVPLARWIIAKQARESDLYRISERYTWDWALIGRCIKFGGPSGMQLLAEAGCFTVILMQVGRLGELPMAATTLALGINVLAFVPMMGLGIGVGVLVGQRLTENRLSIAKRSVRSALLITTPYTLCFAVLLAFFPDQMLWIYRMGASAERFEVIEPMLIPLLRFIAAYCILDGLQIVFVGAIKGAGDTWFVLMATILVSVGAVLIGSLLQSVGEPNLYLWWWVIFGWIVTMLSVFGGRYLSGAWKSKRVIESKGSIPGCRYPQMRTPAT